MSKPKSIKERSGQRKSLRSGSLPTVCEDSFIVRSMSAQPPPTSFAAYQPKGGTERGGRSERSKEKVSSFKATQKIVLGDSHRRLVSPRDAVCPSPLSSSVTRSSSLLVPPEEPAPRLPQPIAVTDWKVHSPMELRRSTFTLDEPQGKGDSERGSERGRERDSDDDIDDPMWDMDMGEDEGDYGMALLSLSTEIGVEMDAGLDFTYWQQAIEPPGLYVVMTFVLQHSVGVKGVFRTPASSVRLTELQEAEAAGTLEAELAKCAQKMTGRLLVADFMNKHFRDMREPLVPVHIFHEALDTVDVKEVDFTVREALRALVYNMPSPAIGSFCALLHVAHEALKHSATTGMDATNLSLCLGRTVMYDPSPNLDVIAVRREVRLMSKAMKVLIEDFPAMYQDFVTGMRKVKAESMANRLALRKRLIELAATTEALQAAVGGISSSSPDGSPGTSPLTSPRDQSWLPTRSASAVPSPSKRRPSISNLSSSKEVRSPKKRVAKYISRRVSVSLRRGSHEGGKRTPTDDELTKHKMLEAINVALLNKSNQRIWNLSFDEVQEILLKAGFPADVILRYEKFLQQATLKLVAGMYKK